MKQRINILLTAALIAIGLVACDGGRVLYSEYISVGEEYEWAADEPIRFDVEVTENKHAYELVLAVRVGSGYPYDKLLLHVTEQSPSGESVRRDVEVPVRNAQGEFYGDKGFDLIDIEYILDASKEFPVFGRYTYTVEPAMPEIDPVVYVVELGLILRDIPVK
jgi:gliding motility-associated lipoprotein GldH